MSDDCIQYWSAWKTAFGDSFDPGVKKLLCTWHVLKNWKLQLKKKVPSADDQLWAWHQLNVILHASDAATFTNLVSTFLTEIKQIDGGIEFGKYFFEYYCGRDRIEQWAKWGRRGSKVNTNMYIESFHRILKGKFLNGRQNRRMDTLIFTLIRVARWFLQEYAIFKEKGLSCDVHRLTVMHRRHKNATRLNPDSVHYDEDANVWLFTSETEIGKIYEVQQSNEICECGLKCRYCGICPNLYVCTCPDAVLSTTACKHMHYVHSKKIKPVENVEEPTSRNSDVEYTVEEPTEFPNPAAHLLRSNRGGHLNLVTKSNDNLTQCLRILPTIAGVDAQSTIAQKTSELLALMKTLQVGHSSTLPVVKEIGPANKLPEKQPRFMPARRSKRVRTNGGLTKPSRQEAAAVMDEIPNILASVEVCRECYNKNLNVVGEDGIIEWISCGVCKSLSHRVCCVSNGLLVDSLFVCKLCRMQK